MARFDMSVVEREMSLRQRRRQHLIFVVRKRDGLRASLCWQQLAIPSGSSVFGTQYLPACSGLCLVFIRKSQRTDLYHCNC